MTADKQEPSKNDTTASAPEPKITWYERLRNRFTPVDSMIVSLVVLILFSFGLVVWFNKWPLPSVEQGQPQAPPASAAVPTKPTAPATPYQRKQVIVTEGTFLWSVWVWRSTPWQAAGDPWCFQIDLNAWSKVTLDDVPVLVDCTKSTRSNVTGRRRNGRDSLDVSDCVVAYRDDWRLVR